MKQIKKRMCKVSAFLILLYLLIVSPVSNIVYAIEEEKEIVILHTNDLHAEVKNLGYLKTMKEQTKNSILVDAGDATIGNVLASRTKGEAVIEMMNEVPYDGMVVGNHEFEYGWKQTIKNSELASFPILGANVYTDKGVCILKQNVMIERDDIKVGFFGIASTETPKKTKAGTVDGLYFQEEIKVAKEQVASLKEQGADIVVALCHVGISKNTKVTSHQIAEQVEGIDIIIDGHSHSIDQSVVNGTYIVQTGTKFENIGRVSIRINKNKEIIDCKSELIPFTTLKDTYNADQSMSKSYEKRLANICPEGEEPVATMKTPVLAYYNGLSGVRASRVEETPAGSMIADAFIETAKEILMESKEQRMPIVSIENGGGIRRNLDENPITLYELYEFVPLKNSLVMKEITPKELYEVLEHGYRKMRETKEGYIDPRYSSGGFAQIGGMRVEVDLTKQSPERVMAIYVPDQKKEKKLDKTDQTTKLVLVSNEFVMGGGDGYQMLTKLSTIAIGPTVEQSIKNYMKNHKKDDIFTYSHTSGRVKTRQLIDMQEEKTFKVILNITGKPNSTYEVIVDGKETQPVTSSEDGKVVLDKLTPGMHTITMDGLSYYISTYTKLGIKELHLNE